MGISLNRDEHKSPDRYEDSKGEHAIEGDVPLLTGAMCVEQGGEDHQYRKGPCRHWRADREHPGRGQDETDPGLRPTLSFGLGPASTRRVPYASDRKQVRKGAYGESE